MVMVNQIIHLGVGIENRQILCLLPVLARHQQEQFIHVDTEWRNWRSKRDRSWNIRSQMKTKVNLRHSLNK